METYSTTSASSSSSPMHLSKYSQEGKSLKASQSLLHSVRKPYQIKPWKKPIAPLPPTPPRIYTVDPINFRDLVQKLTGASDSSEPQENQQLQRLQRVAPPPLDLEKQPALQLLPSPIKTPFSALYQELMSETLPDSKPTSTPFEFNLLSPSTHAWCSFPLLSPGTLSNL